MKNIFASEQTSRLLIGITAVALLGVAYFGYKAINRPHIPQAVVISSCRSPQPGLKRIGGQSWFQFDVPVGDFAIHEGATDAPPLSYGFDLTPKNSSSALVINFLGNTMTGLPLDPVRSSSSHVERNIVDDQGKVLGEDQWGYLKTGERWRQVRLFRGGVTAKYGLVNARDAALFDQVISTVCRFPSSNS